MPDPIQPMTVERLHLALADLPATTLEAEVHVVLPNGAGSTPVVSAHLIMALEGGQSRVLLYLEEPHRPHPDVPGSQSFRADRRPVPCPTIIDTGHALLGCRLATGHEGPHMSRPTEERMAVVTTRVPRPARTCPRTLVGPSGYARAHCLDVTGHEGVCSWDNGPEPYCQAEQWIDPEVTVVCNFPPGHQGNHSWESL